MPLVIRYRRFRNDDPPKLVEVWNEVFTGRGSYKLHGTSQLEKCAFAKPYFDPDGFVVAEENGRVVGFGHAGFGPNNTELTISTNLGVLCSIGVTASHRRRGIGTKLLESCEKYLRKKGARTLFAGPMRPLSPFYFGLYGGSELPGFLNTDRDAAPFLESHNYFPWDTCFVFQRKLDQPINVPDPRFAALRRRFELRVVPRVAVGTWWHESVVGLIEPVEFRLEEKYTGATAVRATVWEMDGFSARYKQPMVGIYDIQVHESLRRQGLGKLFMTQVLQYLQEQCFVLVEGQVMERNRPGLNLYKVMGFEKVDVGRIYKAEK